MWRFHLQMLQCTQFLSAGVADGEICTSRTLHRQPGQNQRRNKPQVSGVKKHSNILQGEAQRIREEEERKLRRREEFKLRRNKEKVRDATNLLQSSVLPEQVCPARWKRNCSITWCFGVGNRKIT